MKTTATLQSRRKSLSAYEDIMNDINNRELQAHADTEERKRIAKEASEDASQNHINGLCKDTQDSYDGMLKAGKDMRQIQDKLAYKEKEEELFNKTADEIYPLKDINEDDKPKMKLRRIAYYGLPILDCVFAWFALSPIITAKFNAMWSLSRLALEAIGVLSSLLVGYGLSILSRVAVASLDDDRSAMRWVKRLAIGVSMAILPLMYIVSEVYYNGGKSWTYSACFAVVSFTIQLLIVSGYKNHVGAFNYFRDKKHNDETMATRKADEKAIRDELNMLHGKEDNIITRFETEYEKFTNSFRELAIARDKHIMEFGKEARYYLNQLVIYIGDLVCFRREVIPLYYESDGAVSAIPFVDFPNVYGVRGILTNSDFVTLEYMFQRGHTGISLTETIRAISKQPYRELNASGSDEGENSDPLQPAEENDVNTTETHDAPLNNESPDSIESDSDNGGIW